MPDNEPEVMTLDELAAMLRVHRSTIYRMLAAGELPAFKMGSDWRFTRATIKAWMAKRIDDADKD